MQKIHAESVGREADFDCMPENVDSLNLNSAHTEFMGGTRSTPLLSCYSQRRTADCRSLCKGRILVSSFCSCCVFVFGSKAEIVKAEIGDLRCLSLWACTMLTSRASTRYDKAFPKPNNAVHKSKNEVQDVRHHKLYIIVSGGCNVLADKFYNLSVDVSSSMSVVCMTPPNIAAGCLFFSWV